MIKASILAVGIFVVCMLENIGHYFGFCFHGWLANIVGCLGIAIGASAIYFKDFERWLTTRGNQHSWFQRKHKCNHEKHHK